MKFIGSALNVEEFRLLSYQERNDIMKYFDALPELVANELEKRGVITDRLLYCVKADLDGEGRYYDVYVTFTS